MTPTCEQLELAAKAAGIATHRLQTRYVTHDHYEDGRVDIIKPWNPVTDKSDSFDLMVACEIEPMYFDDCVLAQSDFLMGISIYAYLKDHNNDKGLAIMWAMFLCAVELGKSFTNGRDM
jgi:hypothetical protein